MTKQGFTIGDSYNALENTYESNCLLLGKEVADAIEIAKKSKEDPNTLEVHEIDLDKKIITLK